MRICLVQIKKNIAGYLLILFMPSMSGWADELVVPVFPLLSHVEGSDDRVQAKSTEESSISLPFKQLGPVLDTKKKRVFLGLPMLEVASPWTADLVPFLDVPLDSDAKNPAITDTFLEEEIPKENLLEENSPSALSVMDGDVRVIEPAKILAVDVHPKMPKIAILIDDLGYSRKGMESSLALPVEVALAILPETPFARKTALAAQKQQRITLLHTPMENQRELELGPGGLYEKMTEEELKEVLNKDLDGLPGIQGANNHMGSLLTAKKEHMQWVMDVLQARSFFFIDSLTNPKSVANHTAQEYGLKTVSRDVFLDNIRLESAIDKQFSRLIKLARLHGSALAIGHPYSETTAYLKKRLNALDHDGVQLVPLSEVLLAPADK